MVKRKGRKFLLFIFCTVLIFTVAAAGAAARPALLKSGKRYPERVSLGQCTSAACGGVEQNYRR